MPEAPYPLDLERPCIEHAQRGPRYARVWHRGRLRSQHVQAWELANGRTVPDGWEVDHLCFNPRCILPAHLEAVPAIVNQRRRRTIVFDVATIAQIRAEYAALPRAVRNPRPGAPLKTQRPVKVVTGTRAALAAKWGITPRYLHEIISGRVWAN